MMDIKLASVVILTHNGEKTVESCLNSVFSQTYDNIEIIVVDNASEDRTIDEAQSVKRKIQSHSAKLKIIKNDTNIGFAGHNVGIENSGGEFVLCINQDVVLEPDFISEAVKLFGDEKVGAVQGKILVKESRIKNQESKIIDTTGIVAFKSRRFADRGQGEKDKGQYEKIEEVFGVNGAAAFFRKKCLEDVKMDSRLRGNDKGVGEFYDSDFFMYKEDIDLSWRIRLYGWKIMYCPKAVAFAERTSVLAGSGMAGAVSARKKQIQRVRRFSFKNHRLAIIKNDLPGLFLKHLPWILPREIGSWLYVLFFEPKIWPAIGKFFEQMPRAWKKRMIIMKNKRIGAGEMERWFR
jgi:GT2 family glycosyltransferase